MLRYIAKRLALSILILFFVMLLIYILMYSLPTSYVESAAGTLSRQPGAQKSAAQWLSELNAAYGMDRGVIGGYFTWLKNALAGDFGDSWSWTVPVTEKFGDVIWYSFALTLTAFVIEIAIAVPLGVAAARKPYGALDSTVTVVSLIGVSLPAFFVATLLKMVFSVKLGWFDVSGMTGRDFRQLSDMGRLLDMARHLVLPVLTLVIVGVGSILRYARAGTLEVLNADYIRTARAKGLPESRVIGYHAFRNTLIPLITILGASLPALFGGALVTETLFAIPGIGYASYRSMLEGDIPFTMFYLAFISMLTLLGSLISDILYAAADPRVRVS